MNIACEVELRPGMTVTSAIGTTSVLVLRIGAATHPPSADGQVMVPGRPTPCGMRARRDRWSAGPVVGRRYIDPPTDLIVLCTRSGRGPLTYDSRPMIMLGPARAER